MSSSEDLWEKKFSRRRFVESAGALVAAGVIGVGLGDVAAQLMRREARKSAVVPALRPSPTRAPSPLYRTTPVGPGPQAASNAFSIFWITDTQFLSESNPTLFGRQLDWIVDNWVPFNGKLVVHTGDIVEHGAVASEWDSANQVMPTLSQNGIPYTWCAGNHDDYFNGDPTSGWIGRKSARAFDPAVVSRQVNALSYASWAGDYHDAMNTAVSFTASGRSFLVVNVEWNAQPDVLAWVEGLLDDPEYTSQHVIIAPHAYMDATGDLDDAEWGATLCDFVSGFTPILNDHPNVFLTLNGHFASECGYNTPTPINGRNQLMFDRQDSTDGQTVPTSPTDRGVGTVDLTPSVPDSEKVGGATVTVLTLDPAWNLITARTYDVYTGGWRTDPAEQYSVPMFSGAAP